jgi:hypothetical protein
MQIIANDIKIKSFHDSQKNKVYSLDTELESLLNIKKPNLSKLYKNHNNIDIIKLTKQILSDFSLSYCTVDNQSKYTYSFYNFSHIGYCDYHYNSNNIEVVLHEVAHCLVDKLFYNAWFNAHGAFFTSILKWLFKYYDLLDDNDFIKANQTATNGKVKFIDDAIIDIKFISIEEIESLKSNKNLELKTLFTSKLSQNLHYQDIENNRYHYIAIDLEQQTAIYTIRKLFAFEKNYNSFEESTEKELENFMMVSPVVKMDSYGYHCTAKSYCEYGYINCWVEKRDGEYVIIKKINMLYYKEDCIKDMKETIICSKLSKQKYKKYSSFNKFEETLEHLNSRLPDARVKRVLNSY